MPNATFFKLLSVDPKKSPEDLIRGPETFKLESKDSAPPGHKLDMHSNRTLWIAGCITRRKYKKTTFYSINKNFQINLDFSLMINKINSTMKCI